MNKSSLSLVVALLLGMTGFEGCSAVDLKSEEQWHLEKVVVKSHDKKGSKHRKNQPVSKSQKHHQALSQQTLSAEVAANQTF